MILIYQITLKLKISNNQSCNEINKFRKDGKLIL